MYLQIFHVDAFTDRAFGGNPAAVCPLAEWLDDDLLRAVAAENNLSETAYFVPNGEGVYELRWFTPKCEVKLCGHATLATGFVILQIIAPGLDKVHFETRFSGPLKVSQQKSLFEMDFPILAPWSCQTPPLELVNGLGLQPLEILQIEDNFFAVYQREPDVRNLRPNLRLLEKLHPACVAVTAPGNHVDFVSRYFAPSYGIPEDPVTGSTHCSLAPYWAGRLGKTYLHARQASERGGELWCKVKDSRISIEGKAVLMLKGELHL
jgi:PhzF family phenazine biosynthesis protein